MIRVSAPHESLSISIVSTHRWAFRAGKSSYRNVHGLSTNLPGNAQVVYVCRLMNRILVTFLLFQVFLISNGFGQGFSHSNTVGCRASLVENQTSRYISSFLSRCQSSDTELVLPASEWRYVNFETSVFEETEEENKTNSKKHAELQASSGSLYDTNSLILMSSQIHGIPVSSFDTISDDGQRYLVIRVFRV